MQTVDGLISYVCAEETDPQPGILTRPPSLSREERAEVKTLSEDDVDEFDSSDEEGDIQSSKKSLNSESSAFMSLSTTATTPLAALLYSNRFVSPSGEEKTVRCSPESTSSKSPNWIKNEEISLDDLMNPQDEMGLNDGTPSSFIHSTYVSEEIMLTPASRSLNNISYRRVYPADTPDEFDCSLGGLWDRSNTGNTGENASEALTAGSAALSTDESDRRHCFRGGRKVFARADAFFTAIGQLEKNLVLTPMAPDRFELERRREEEEMLSAKPRTDSTQHRDQIFLQAIQEMTNRKFEDMLSPKTFLSPRTRPKGKAKAKTDEKAAIVCDSPALVSPFPSVVVLSEPDLSPRSESLDETVADTHSRHHNLPAGDKEVMDVIARAETSSCVECVGVDTSSPSSVACVSPDVFLVSTPYKSDRCNLEGEGKGEEKETGEIESVSSSAETPERRRFSTSLASPSFLYPSPQPQVAPQADEEDAFLLSPQVLHFASGPLPTLSGPTSDTVHSTTESNSITSSSDLPSVAPSDRTESFFLLSAAKLSLPFASKLSLWLVFTATLYFACLISALTYSNSRPHSMEPSVYRPTIPILINDVELLMQSIPEPLTVLQPQPQNPILRHGTKGVRKIRESITGAFQKLGRFFQTIGRRFTLKGRRKLPELGF